MSQKVHVACDVKYLVESERLLKVTGDAYTL